MNRWIWFLAPGRIFLGAHCFQSCLLVKSLLKSFTRKIQSIFDSCLRMIVHLQMKNHYSSHRHKNFWPQHYWIDWLLQLHFLFYLCQFEVMAHHYFYLLQLHLLFYFLLFYLRLLQLDFILTQLIPYQSFFILYLSQLVQEVAFIYQYESLFSSSVAQEFVWILVWFH